MNSLAKALPTRAAAVIGGRIARRADTLARLIVRRPASRHGVLIVTSGGLGDTVLFALLLPRFFTLARDGEPVTVLLRSDAAKMAFLFPPGVRTFAVDYKRLAREPRYRLSMMVRLRAAGFRMVVSVDHLRHPHLDESLVRACAAPETVAMEPRPWPKYQRALARNRRVYHRLFPSGDSRRDKMLRWTAFADWLTGEVRPPPPIRLPAAMLPAPEPLPRPTILFQPFSAVAAKQSPPAFYLALMDGLPGHDFVVLGAPGDLDRSPEFRVLLERARFEPAPFKALLPLLRAAALVVSVDTALMHLAVAAGAPTLCLASAAYVGEMVPYAKEVEPDNVVFLSTLLPCEGCLGDCSRALEHGMYPCVALLDPAVAVEMARQLLNGGTGMAHA